MSGRIWNAIGAVAAVLGVAAAVVLYFLNRDESRQQRKKALEVTRSMFPTTIQPPQSDSLKGRLVILYEGVPIEKFFTVRSQVRNSGNQPITSDDFEKPLRLQLGNVERVVVAEVVEQKPSNIGASVTIMPPRGVEIAPLLLNPGDSFTIDMAGVARATQRPILTSATARIRDVQSVDVTTEPLLVERDLQRSRSSRGILFGLVIFLAVNLVYVGWSLVRNNS